MNRTIAADRVVAYAEQRLSAVNGQPNHSYLPAGQGRKWRVLDVVVEAKLTAEQTNGAYTVYEITAPPGGGSPPLHTHPPQETFYVLEGAFTFGGLGADGPAFIRATTGATVHIPAGAPHSFHNSGDQTGRLLVIYEPPGKMQDFFAAMHLAVNNAEPLTAPLDDLPSPEQAQAIFAEHEIVVLP